MSRKEKRTRDFNVSDAIAVERALDINLYELGIMYSDLAIGMNVELEHGKALGEATNVTDDDTMMTAKIALAHLIEDPKYYEKLAKSGIKGEGRENPSTPIGSHGSYEKLYFDVPQQVKANAKRGIEESENASAIDLARAKQLSTGKPRVTLRDIVNMRQYFARHKTPSPLWGGAAGKQWAKSIAKQSLCGEE